MLTGLYQANIQEQLKRSISTALKSFCLRQHNFISPPKIYLSRYHQYNRLLRYCNFLFSLRNHHLWLILMLLTLSQLVCKSRELKLKPLNFATHYYLPIDWQGAWWTLLTKTDFICVFHLFCYLSPPIQRKYPIFPMLLKYKCRFLGSVQINQIPISGQGICIFNKHTHLGKIDPF